MNPIICKDRKTEDYCKNFYKCIICQFNNFKQNMNNLGILRFMIKRSSVENFYKLLFTALKTSKTELIGRIYFYDSFMIIYVEEFEYEESLNFLSNGYNMKIRDYLLIKNDEDSKIFIELFIEYLLLKKQLHGCN